MARGCEFALITALCAVVLMGGAGGARAGLGVNFAPQGTATASSFYGPGYEIPKGIDGDMTTRWSGAEREQWYAVEWPAQITFNTVILRNLDADWNRNIPFTLQAWDEGTSAFVNLMTVTPASSTVLFTFPTRTARKIRVTNVITFWELEVYNDDGIPDPPPPTHKVSSAVMIEPEGEFRLSLDGDWRFLFGPSSLPGFHDPGYSDTSWETLQVPSNWEMSRSTKPDQPGYDQGYGYYRRWISVPVSWQGRRIFAYFRGVNNSAELWVNGQRIDYHESGYTSFRMDITPAVQFGQDNLVAVKVCKQSASSDLDIGGYWHLAGIYRGVALVAVPEIRMEDYRIVTTLPAEGACRASVRVDVTSEDAGLLVEAELADASDSIVASASAPVVSKSASLALDVSGARLWSAEDPYRYTLRLRLVGSSQQVIHSISDKVGLRQVSIIDGVLCVNRKPIWIHGFNRHETHAYLGRALNTSVWLQDIEMMKAANVNTVRTCHYNPDPEFIRLCDEHGLYVIEEVPFCWAHDKGLGDPLKRHAFIKRAEETLARDANQPSIIIWSLGNENLAYGSNLQAVIDYVAEHDPSRPKLSPAIPIETFPYQGLDINSLHYPSIQGIRGWLNGTGRRDHPTVMTEATGVFTWVPDGLKWDPNQRDYWAEGERNYVDAFHELGPVNAGGCIWAWMDEGLHDKWSPEGGVIYCHPVYGNWGPWGVVDVYRDIKPEYWNTKKFYSPIRVKDLSLRLELGQSPCVGVRSFYSFTDFSRIAIEWRVLRDGQEVAAGSASAEIPPNTEGVVDIPWTAPACGRHELEVRFTDWNGHEVDIERIAMDVVSGLQVAVRPEPRISASGPVGVSVIVSSSADAQGEITLSASAGEAVLFTETVPVTLPAGEDVPLHSIVPLGGVTGEFEVQAVLRARGAELTDAAKCYRLVNSPESAVAARNNGDRTAIADLDFPYPGGAWRAVELASGSATELTASACRLVGAVRVPAGEEKVFALEPSQAGRQGRLSVTIDGQRITASCPEWSALFDASTGRLISISSGGPLITRGPEFYIGEETPGINGLNTEWTLGCGLPAMNGTLIPRWRTGPRISLGPDCMVVRASADYDLQTASETYQVARVDWTYYLTHLGKLRVTTDVHYTGRRMHAWELGTRFGLASGLSQCAWQRETLWTVYPDGHIGRPWGSAPIDSIDGRGSKIDATEVFLTGPDGRGIGLFPQAKTFNVRCRPLQSENEVFVSSQVSPLGDVGSLLMPERVILMEPGTQWSFAYSIVLPQASGAAADVKVLSADRAVSIVPTQVALDWRPPTVVEPIGALLCVGREPTVDELSPLPLQPVNLYRNPSAVSEVAAACAGAGSYLVIAEGVVSGRAGYDAQSFFGSPEFEAFLAAFLQAEGTVVLPDSPVMRESVGALSAWLPPIGRRQHPFDLDLLPYQQYDRTLIELDGVGDTAWPGGPDTWWGFNMTFKLADSPRMFGDLTLETIDWDHGGRIQEFYSGGALIRRLENFDTAPVRVTASFDESMPDVERSILVVMIKGNNAVVTRLEFRGGYIAQWQDFRESGMSTLCSYFDSGRLVRTSPDGLSVLLTGSPLPDEPQVPDPPAIICDKPTGWSVGQTNCTFTALSGFGASSVDHYRVVWDTSPTRPHWTGSEPRWNSGTLAYATAPGAWYLHVRSYGASGVPGGSIDLGPYAFETTPPPAPVVTDGGFYTGSRALSCSWVVSDPESGIHSVAYAIGITPSDTGSYAVGWTYLGPVSEFTRSVPMVQGKAYYVYVKARNNAGWWSPVGVSDGIRYAEFAAAASPAEAKQFPDGAYVEITVPQVVSAVFGGSLYVQPADRSAGIAVIPAAGGAIEGDSILVRGRLATRYGERVIEEAEVR